MPASLHGHLPDVCAGEMFHFHLPRKPTPQLNAQIVLCVLCLYYIAINCNKSIVAETSDQHSAN